MAQAAELKAFPCVGGQFHDETVLPEFEQFLNEEIRTVEVAEAYFGCVRTACHEFLEAIAQDIVADPRNFLVNRGAIKLRRVRGLCIQLTNALSGLSKVELAYLTQAVALRPGKPRGRIHEVDFTELLLVAAAVADADVSYLVPRPPSPRNWAEVKFGRDVVNGWVEIVSSGLRRTKSVGQPFQRTIMMMLPMIRQKHVITLKLGRMATLAGKRPVWSKTLVLADYQIELNKAAARGVREILGSWS
jgi:hypothetical protein